MAKNSQRCCIPFSNLCLYSDKVIAEEWEYMMLLFNWDFETTLWNVRIRLKLIKNKHKLTMISCCLGVQAPHGAQIHMVLLMWLINWIKLNYSPHYKSDSITDFITNSITNLITKVLLTSLQSVTDFITDWLCCKVIITNANNVLNGHSNTYFSPPAGLILFLKIIFDRMSLINILEGLQLWTAKHDSFDISWSWIFGDKPTSDLDSAHWNTSKNISPKFFPWGFRVAIILEQIFTTLCTPLKVLAQKVLYFWLEFHY